MLTITSTHVNDSLDRGNPPAATCQSGDLVRFETRDAYDNALMPDGSTLPGQHMQNPATGPLYVESAQPGDVLRVDILGIDIAEQALMRTHPTAGAFQHNITERRIKAYDVTGGFVQFTPDIALALRPMIGVIGTAPAGEGVPTSTPGDHGGNMDCKEIVQGSTLYLPVNVPGGLLSMGDLHALMGDGESLICGLEVQGAVTVRVTVVSGFALPTPCLVSNGRFATIQSAPTLDQAAVKAARCMQDFLAHHGPIDLYDAGRLLSLAGDLAICQIVDPWMTVRMSVDRALLAQCGIRLP